MYKDISLVLDDANALAASGNSQKAQDFGAVQSNIGVGRPIGIALTVNAAPAAGGTYLVTLETAAAWAAGALTAPVIALVDRVIPADTPAGTTFWIDIPGEVTGLMKEYIDLLYTLGGSNPTLNVSAEIRPRDFQENVYTVPNGYVIL